MRRPLLPLLALLLLGAGSTSPDERGYLRTPDLHDDTVVFAAEGDLWRVPVAGGTAARLTTHDGEERTPRFSPDGRWIAFTGEYDGNTDVFVMPAEGGEPRRLTWHPDRDEVLGWTPDGQQVLFRSPREQAMSRTYELFTVPAAGGDVTKLPLGWAALVDMDPRTGLWAFNRISREYRTWKRYRGGTAQDIWVGHPDRADYRKVTDFPGTDAFPMWHDGRVWFLSDVGGTLNLWSMAPDGSDRTRHTHEDTWDLRWPAMAPDGRIVAMRAGDVVLYDPAKGALETLPVRLPSERNLARKRLPDAAEHLSWYDLSPDGDRVVIVSRGEVFSVPVEDGVTLPITRGSGARESWARYSPDGKRVVYVTDESGEEAIVTADAWGRGDVRTVKPPGERGWHFPPTWSPDGKWIAWADQTMTLSVAPAEGGAVRVVDRSTQWEITSYAWSPDGRWLAYARTDPGNFSSIFVWDSRTGQSHAITGPTTDDHDPAWDPESRYLYFLSGRTVNPFLGNRDFQYITAQGTRPYAVLLRPDVEPPFAARAGLPIPAAEKAEEKGKKRKRKLRDLGIEEPEEGAPKPVEITFAGIQQRVVAFPVEAGDHTALGATADTVYYLSLPMGGMAGGGGASDLVAFDLEAREAEVFVPGATGYELSLDRKKMVVSMGGGALHVVDTAGGPPDLAEGAVDLSNAVIELDPRAEWRQIYFEGWRLMRDFYWESGMAGLDWAAIRDRYATLLPRLATREDLRDLMGEVIGELATSHTYVWGGDRGTGAPWVATGLLGADVEREGEAFRVTRIYRGDPADNVVSPLLEPGSEVRPGEYILAVDHRPFVPGEPFLAALQGRAGRPVLLTVSDRPQGGKVREVVVTPLGDEHGLRYADWVRRNREYVDQQSHGRLGYLHIPDMGTRGLVAFDTWFHPQVGKEGLVVDVRWNGGGFVSQLIVERLRRRVIAVDRSRAGGLWTYPERALNGPFVVITNEFAGSDGDIFPTAIQIEGLAPVIGQRSWGGVIGIRGDKPLVDGGMLTQPEFAFWFPGQGWGLENRGVVPDIEIQNLPQDLAAGRDPQLDRAIQECLALRAAGTWMAPTFEPPPAKSREAFQEREAAR